MYEYKQLYKYLLRNFDYFHCKVRSKNKQKIERHRRILQKTVNFIKKRKKEETKNWILFLFHLCTCA